MFTFEKTRFEGADEAGMARRIRAHRATRGISQRSVDSHDFYNALPRLTGQLTGQGLGHSVNRFDLTELVFNR